MLSILIPTYNYDITLLVRQLKVQLEKVSLTYEIIVADDASSHSEIIKKNKGIEKLSFCKYIGLKENIGRSKIRNLLTKQANHDNLLFLDADVVPLHDSFIQVYLDHLPLVTDVVYGGIVYQAKKPKKQQVLRWKYGNNREALSVEKRVKEPYISFLTLNFLIKKSVFDKVTFNEEIPNLRCEDTLFAMEAKKNKLSIHHIHNPIIHLGLETSEIFLKKSLESIDVRKSFVKEKLLYSHQTKITHLAKKIYKLRLHILVVLAYRLIGSFLKRNILSANPSMIAFDLYRLGYYFDSKER
ncbi:glycosyltransferase family 2 protein [Aquimarina sp. MMG016]|uniref:glycosyltransferase family 2 protein n=1 Tax=Aquimarina sp. MMG016 TaxID=2822690 RepID=UPI001B3A00DD|nr:glycosyltransferase family 2 protein [Aquimarina sp. MMG016]MBQ4822194.1 glycosyltransferase family 2 protein [Aquimarina sp. MMG016]